LRRALFGAPRDLHDPHLFHTISLIAFLAWVGLGADGLSSSAYGPDEAYRALEGHTELAVFLALATAVTVFIISYAYSRIIEHFPHGGGGYLVATKLLGAPFGVISGSALLVDYVLTITTSIASGADQIFSLPYLIGMHAWKVPVEAAVIGVLVMLNLRGVKESITTLVPIFIVFVVTHVIVLVSAFVMHARHIPQMAHEINANLRSGLSTTGLMAMMVLLARAYSRGAGTYTGIEAVSNGIQIMREPKVPTAKRTMVYMAVSLSVTAGGILLCYLLLNVSPEKGKTLNAVMTERLGFGDWFVILVLGAEAALLFVAAQTGFIDGPRVMANMAVDSWLPHRFSSLSDRLTMHYGVILMGAASIATLFYTHGQIDALVTMYSINVFITFSLSNMGMIRFWITERDKHPDWKRHLPVHVIGLVLCLGILTLVVYEKFWQGAWLTVIVTSILIAVCALIRRHYRTVYQKLAVLSNDLGMIPTSDAGKSECGEVDPTKPTAVLLVGGYNGLGIHSMLTIFRLFPNYYKQLVFLSVAVIDSGNFKGAQEVDRLEAETREALRKYVELSNRLGFPAQSMMTVGTEPVAECEKLCAEASKRFPRATFFAGKLVFQRERWYQRLLHNETAHAIQRRLQWEGMPMVVLPVRVQGG
jgi:amino acid transporter